MRFQETLDSAFRKSPFFNGQKHLHPRTHRVSNVHAPEDGPTLSWDVIKISLLVRSELVTIIMLYLPHYVFLPANIFKSLLNIGSELKLLLPHFLTFIWHPRITFSSITKEFGYFLRR